MRRERLLISPKLMAFPRRFASQMASLSLITLIKPTIQLISTPCCSQEHVRIPLVTGNAELDFMNELYTTALRSGLLAHSLQVKMVNLSFMATTTTISRPSLRAQQEALKNRLPQIQSKYDRVIMMRPLCFAKSRKPKSGQSASLCR